MIKSIFIIFKKESIDAIRDVRSLIITFIFPLIVFPAVILLTGSKTDTIYNISVSGIDESIIAHLQADPLLLVSKNEITDKNASLFNYRIDASLSMYNKANFKAIEIEYNNSYKRSIEALEYLKVKLTEYQMNNILENPDIKHTGFIVTFMPIHDIYEGASMFILYTLLPVLIIIISITSPIAVAADVFAGEKERNSLELLLCNPVSKFAVVLGKYFTVFLFGFMGVLCFLAGFFISVSIDSTFLGISELIITSKQISYSLFLVAILSFVTSSIEVCISITAKSVKEAQLYILPLTVIFSAINYFSDKSFFSVTDTNISSRLDYIPVLNIMTSMRTVMMNNDINNPLAILLTNIVASIIVLYISKLLLNREKIIYRS
ncbi:MAG TPA: ABC transporter permease subunit [Spirochaetota bacterium]|nr:ABC transporter permease subunit [Spirochaetota bacterium]